MPDSIALQLLASFTRIAATDGGRIELIDGEGARIIIGLTPGDAAPCEDGACVLPHSELQQMMSEWLSRRAPDRSVTVKLMPAANGEGTAI